jgi:hypothetical protein
MRGPGLLCRFSLVAGAFLASFATPAAVAPVISGSPPKAVAASTRYSFTPTATDADGSSLRFIIANRPAWATFDTRTGTLSGTPAAGDVGTYADVTLRVTDETYWRTLPLFSITVSPPVRKANYGHYFATRYQDTAADIAMLCEQAGVKGVQMRRTWREFEPQPGVYDFSAVDAALAAIAVSRNPQCQLWVMAEFKSFNASPIRQPAPGYLAQYSALNNQGLAYSMFMWEPVIGDAYVRLMRAMAARYDTNPRFEGFLIQETALGFYDQYSQDVAAGGTYTATRWRDALARYVTECGKAFQQSRCMIFANFVRGDATALQALSQVIASVPDNRVCLAGPDLLPDEKALYGNDGAAYEVLTRHAGCRANSAQNDSYAIWQYPLGAVFNFAVRGTFGDFNQVTPRASGVCVNSYLFWNHRTALSYTGFNWLDALPVIAAYPYGPLWLEQCAGGGGAP